MTWLFMGLVVLGLLVPYLVAEYRVYLMTLVCIYIITAVGLNVVMGFSGQISIAQGAFMGVGAYTTAWLMAEQNLHFFLALIVAVALTTALGFVVGLPALRVAGHYLALATLAFQIIIERAIFNWDPVTNGARGLAVPSVELGGTLLRGNPLYYLVLVIAVVTILFVRNVVTSRVGRAWRALRDQPVAAVVFGMNAARYKTTAFAVSAALGGLAGSLLAVTLGYLDPLAFTLWESVKQLTMVIFGGLGTLSGPIVGAAVLESLPSFLTVFEERALMMYFIILLAVLLFFPGGIAKAASEFSSWLDGLRRRMLGPKSAVVSTPEQPVSGAGAPPDVSAGVPEMVGASNAPVGSPLLETSGVSVHFGGLVALKDVDLVVRRGEIKGLIGPNGAGKTTLFNILTRVYTPSEGSVRFDGSDLRSKKRHQLAGIGISRTFQNVAMFRSMTVLENVMVGSHHRRSAGLWRNGFRTIGSLKEERAARREALEVLSFLNLAQYADTMADTLPVGLQRRVEIARALSARPSLLLLDEPASGLTANEATQLMDDIRMLRDVGMTVLVIEHNIRFVMGLVDSVSVLDHGRVIFTGLPADAQTDDQVITAYLGTDEGDQEGSAVDELHT